MVPSWHPNSPRKAKGSSGPLARRDRDIGVQMGLWGDGGGAVRVLECHEREVEQAGLVRKHQVPCPGTAPQGASPQTLDTQISPFLEQ